jgi:hypothetical protein
LNKPIVQRKSVKQGYVSDSRDEFPDDIKFDPAKPTHNSNVKGLRLTGIGKQNATVIDRQDSRLDELIGELNIDKPGAKAFIQRSIDAYTLAVQNGTWPQLNATNCTISATEHCFWISFHDTGFLPAVDIAFLAKAARAECPSKETTANDAITTMSCVLRTRISPIFTRIWR